MWSGWPPILTILTVGLLKRYHQLVTISSNEIATLWEESWCIVLKPAEATWLLRALDLQNTDSTHKWNDFYSESSYSLVTRQETVLQITTCLIIHTCRCAAQKTTQKMGINLWPYIHCMWEFWIEIEYYSADYFKHITMYEMHYHWTFACALHVFQGRTS